MRKFLHVAPSGKKLLSLMVFCFVNIYLLYEVSGWVEEMNNIRAYSDKLKRREEMLAEIHQYNKENVKNAKQSFPKVIGIGVKKCGTDGVIRFLNHHPMVRIPPNVEAFFFNSESREYDKYIEKMPPTNDRQVGMEKTPIYFGSQPVDMPQRIKEAIPDVKLILIVCDPTARAFSDYVHERERNRLFGDKLLEKYETFDSYVDENLPKLQRKIKDWKLRNISYENKNLRNEFVRLFQRDAALTMLSNGIYTAHINSWKAAFNQSNLKIIEGKQFIKSPGPIIEELQDFIGLPKVLFHDDFVRNPDKGFYCYRQFTMDHLHNETKKTDWTGTKCLEDTKGRTRNNRKEASEITIKKLQAFYHPFNEQFYKDVGVDYGWQ